MIHNPKPRGNTPSRAFSASSTPGSVGGVQDRCAGSVRAHGRGRAHGFTLIELLVVISIIALLISILLPTLSSARKAARGMQCLSVLRQLAMTNEIYANEHDNLYTWFQAERWNSAKTVRLAMEWPRNPDFRRLILDRRNAIENDWPVGLACPDATFARTLGRNADSTDMRRVYGYVGYRGSIHRVDNPADTKPHGLDRDQVLSPSNSLQFVDMLFWVATETRALNTPYTGENSQSQGMIAYRHNEAANVAFFDGHASAMKREAIVGPDSNIKWVRID